MSERASGSSDAVRLGEGFVAECRSQLADSRELIRHCVDQLDEEQVWWRPHEDMNSIGNLLLHLAGNLRQRILSFAGNDADVRDRPREFTARGPIPKATLLEGLEDVVTRADGFLASLTASRLLEVRNCGVLDRREDDTIQGLLFRTFTHLVGHTQEIVQMTRTQLGDRYVFRQPAGVPWLNATRANPS